MVENREEYGGGIKHSECFYHIQLTVKYRKSLLNKKVGRIDNEALKGFKDRYAIEIRRWNLIKTNIHILCRFLPSISGGRLIKIIKRHKRGRKYFKKPSEIKKDCGRRVLDRMATIYPTISGKGIGKHREVHKNQGRDKDIEPTQNVRT